MLINHITWTVARTRTLGGTRMSAFGGVVAAELGAVKPATDASYDAQGAPVAWSPPD
jgi:hypothetical protein